MLLGTVFGVIIIPGLYYIFARLAEGRQLIKDEYDRPLSEESDRHQGDPSFQVVKPQRADSTEVINNHPVQQP
jgi:hypothetical protein